MRVFVLVYGEDYLSDEGMSLGAKVFLSREDAERCASSLLLEDWECAPVEDNGDRVIAERPFSSFEAYSKWVYDTGRMEISSRTVVGS